MKTCHKCLAVGDWICTNCGGCPDCCKCPPNVQLEKWKHVSTREGALFRNNQIREAVRGEKK